MDKNVTAAMNLTKEELITAKFLCDGGRYRDSVTHSYYAMFTAAKAILLTREFNGKTHDGTLKQFGKEFVHDGDFDYEIYKYYYNARKERNISTYDFFATFTQDQAEEKICEAESFLQEIERII